MTKRREAKTILIIEDEAEVQDFASRVLELEGYHILQAEDGDGGLKLLSRGGISLVLLDLSLPKVNGWAVLKQMKEEPGLSAIPVIIFTASAGTDQRAQALKMGVVDYLVKPVSVASLRKTVARFLQQER